MRRRMLQFGSVSLAIFCALIIGSGCSRCGGTAGSPTPIDALIPKGAVAMVVVPSLKNLGQRLQMLESLKTAALVAQTRGFSAPRAFSDAVAAELGFDLRNASDLEKIGLNPDGAGGVFAVVPQKIMLILPVKNEARFLTALGTVVQNRLGAAVSEDKKDQGIRVVTFRNREGQERANCAFRDGYVLIGAEQFDAASVRAQAALGASDSISTDAFYLSRRARANAADLVMFVPTGSPVLMNALATNAWATVSMQKEKLSINVEATWKEAKSLSALNVSDSAAVKIADAPADAFVRMGFRGDWTKIEDLVRSIAGERILRVLDDEKIDLNRDVFSLLAPGLMMALSLAEQPPIALGMSDLNLRKTNPFSYVQLIGAIHVKSEASIEPSIDKLVSLAPKFGATMKKSDRPLGQFVVTSYAQGEGVHFAHQSNRIFFGAPLTRLENIMRGTVQSSRDAKAQSEALQIVFDFKQLAKSIRSIPESAWGIGGFAMKATALRWLDAVSDLSSLTIQANAQAQTLAVQGHLAFSPEAFNQAK